MICLNSNIPIILDVPLGVETVTRTGPEAIFIFIINHNDVDVTVELKNDVYKDAINGCDLTGNIKMEPQGVVVLQK
jgi:beta-galactosidase GanA